MRTLTQIKFQSLSVNCKLQTPHPNQQPFKGMISDSFLQSSESMKGQDDAVNVWICGEHSGDDGMRYLSRRGRTPFSLQVADWATNEVRWRILDFNVTFLSCPANQKGRFVSPVVLLLWTDDQRTWQTRTQLAYMKHTSSVPIQVLLSTLLLPRAHACCTHYIKFVSDGTFVVLGQLATPTMHFTLASGSSNIGQENGLHSPDVQVCTQEVHMLVHTGSY